MTDPTVRSLYTACDRDVVAGAECWESDEKSIAEANEMGLVVPEAKYRKVAAFRMEWDGASCAEGKSSKGPDSVASMQSQHS